MLKVLRLEHSLIQNLKDSVIESKPRVLCNLFKLKIMKTIENLIVNMDILFIDECS